MSRQIDVLSRIAETLRLRGSLSGVCSHSPPWGYEMPKTDHAALLVVTRGRIYFEISGPKRRALELGPGDVLGMPHGHPFSIRDDPGTPLRPATESGSCANWKPDRPRRDQTEFIALCCEFQGGSRNPLLQALPSLIHCPGSDGNVARWLEPTVRLLTIESMSSNPGRSTVLDRLAEVVFIQLIRTWVEGLREGEGGWLGALGDPQLASALEAIHADPGQPWTVASLAARARMSRSAFAGRFKDLVGQTPLEYLTRWRMQQAATLLESDHLPLKEVVAASGYASEAAFRNVFRKWVGVSPGSYRTRARVPRL